MAKIAAKSCKDEATDEEGEEQSCWPELTSDLLELIFSRLHTGDRMSFNAVCKSWKSIAALPPPLLPCGPALILPQTSNSSYKLFHSMSDQFSPTNNIMPELKYAKIRCSNFGWLLMSWRDERNHPMKLFFFNPFTKEKIDVPSSIHQFIAMSFSAPPTSKNWSIFGILTRNSHRIQIGFIKCGDEEWGYYAYNLSSKFHVCHGIPVFYENKYYILDIEGHLFIYNVENPGDCINFSAPTSIKKLRSSVHQSFLVELDGQLLALLVTRDWMKVSVKVIDTINRTWETVVNLGDHMLYVSNSSSFGETAPQKSMANKIYFSKFFGNSGVFYSLNTKKYHSYDAKFSSKESYGLKDNEFGTWIIPPKYSS